MDVQMPGMDGLAATRSIRSQLPPDRQPRILAMTAHAMLGDRERCLEAGMDGYLSKPVQIATLAEALAATPRRSPAAGSIELPADPFDRATLDQMLGLPIGPVLVGLYTEGSTADLAKLRQLVEEERWPETARIIHSLKGSSATLGLVRVVALCALLEEAVRGAYSSEALALVPRLEKEVESACGALAREVTGARPRYRTTT